MNDIIFAKISTIKKCLQRIVDTTKLNPDCLENDIDKQDIFMINLQRAIQATIDISNIIIKSFNLNLPVNYANAFEIIEKHNFIDSEIKEKMIKMSGFRNIAVHDYQTINIEILKSILKNNLNDFEEFYLQILKNI
jgi:uncharacterized protein YutE (UPF0331/DUF86 family)